MHKFAVRAAYVLTLGLLAAQVYATSVQQTQQARLANAPDPAFARITDDPKLPRVLLIGDSISIGYTVPTRELLEGQANVHRVPVNGGATIRGLTHLEKWIGNGKWDVIHFNWGLHDLRTQPKGNVQVPLEEYSLNLEELVRRLEKTGAQLIWASTTPVLDIKSTPPRRNADVVAYNDAAKKIMDDHSVMIDDLYGVARPQLEKIQNSDDLHFTADGSRLLAESVSARILEALGQGPDGTEN